MAIQKIIAAVGANIAERGLAYFKKHKVVSLEKIRSTWFAKVEGTYPYYVELRLNKQGGLSRGVCSCPYEFRCKHIAAVWFAVLAQTEGSLPVVPNNAVIPSDEDLYLKNLRDVCNRYAKGCDYWQSHRCADELSPFLEGLDCLSPEYQFKLLKTFYGRLNTIIQRSDDSDGLLGDLMREAAADMNSLYIRSKDKKLQKQLEQSWKKWLIGRENFVLAETFGILAFWQNALNRSNRAQEVLDWVAEYEKTAESDEENNITVWRYNALKHLDTEQAEAFLQAHMEEVPALRQLAVESLLERQNYTEAEQLLLSGVQSKRGFLYKKQWLEYLLQIAQKTRQKDKTIEYAEKLILTDDNLIHPLYYHALKAVCNAQEWQKECEKIEAFSRQHGLNEKLAQFFVLEKNTEKLKALLLACRHIPLIAKYTAKVPKSERQDVVFHWLALLEQSMKELNVRRKYAQWVRSAKSLLRKYPYIRSELANIVSRFQTTYKARTALMEELEGLGFQD